MATAKIYKLNALPQTFEANAFYFVPEGASGVGAYVANAAGTGVRKLEGRDPASVLIISDTRPDPAVTTAMLWSDSSTGSLFVKTDVQGTPTWVEVISTAPPPTITYGGTGGFWGTGTTVARSDHQHDGIYIEATW